MIVDILIYGLLFFAWIVIGFCCFVGLKISDFEVKSKLIRAAIILGGFVSLPFVVFALCVKAVIND